MGWFSKREPVYSEMGNHLFVLMSQNQHLWSPGAYGWVNNLRTKVSVRLDGVSSVEVEVAHQGVSHLLTRDDHRRIRNEYGNLRTWLVQSKNVEMADIIKKDMTSVADFDSTARTLAKAVLAGDKAAARALVDRCVELVQEGEL